VQSAVAFSSKDAWAFGLVGRGDGSLVPYSARYNGQRWRPVTLPGMPLAVSAVSHDDMWAVGPSLKTATQPVRRQVFIAMHWTGGHWLTLPLPKARLPKGQDLSYTGSVVAVGPGEVWCTYRIANSQNTIVSGLLHWHAGQWQTFRLPADLLSIDGTAQDGQGGLWLTATIEKNYVDYQYWYHFQSGRWTARRGTLSPKGYGSTYFAMAWIPGTQSVWAVGEADGNRTNRSAGVIAKYGS
jgi:hypothetical protein